MRLVIGLRQKLEGVEKKIFLRFKFKFNRFDICEYRTFDERMRLRCDAIQAIL